MTALVAAAAGMASGVFLRSFLFLGWPVPAFLLLITGLFAAAHRRTPRSAYLLSAVFLAFLTLGILRTSLTDAPPPERYARDVGSRVAYEAVVARDADVRDANTRVIVRVGSGSDAVLMLAIAKSADVSVGDLVRVRGTLEVPEAFADDNGRVFRYDKYLQTSGIRFVLRYATIATMAPAPWYSLPSALSRMKRAFVHGIDAALPEPNASLASGMVIGGKSGLGPELEAAFVRSGLIQIVVLSGYNIMVIAEWVMAALARFRLSRRTASIAAALALLLFVGAAGAGATALRAALMALIALYARATGKTYAAGRALLAAVIAMLVFDPLYLAFDPGFGLSVAATAGIIYMAPAIERRLGFLRSPFLANAAATTVAAQAAVLPLLIYDTGNLSFVALPANLLAMGAVPVAMGLAAVAGISGMLLQSAPALAALSGLPSYAATEYLIKIAETAASLPLAAVTIAPLPFILVPGAYAALAAIASAKRVSGTLQLMFARKAST